MTRLIGPTEVDSTPPQNNLNADVGPIPAIDSINFVNTVGDGAAVAEIDLGINTAKSVTALAQEHRAEDLEGVRLLHAARTLSRHIYERASWSSREAFAAFAHGTTDVLIVHHLFEVLADLEPTPNDHEPSERSRLYALANAGLGLACGLLPVAVSNENGGRYDRHVRRIAGREKEKSSSSNSELGPHTEHSFRGHGGYGRSSPQVDALILSGLRNDLAEPTGFAALRDVLSHMRPHAINLLQQPIFGMEPPDSSEARGTVWDVPIFYKRHGRLECAYRADKCHLPDRADAREAVNELNAAIKQVPRAVTLLPGTTWIARNTACFHWRDEVKSPNRWLLRGFGLVPHTAGIFADAARPDLMQY